MAAQDDVRLGDCRQGIMLQMYDFIPPSVHPVADAMLYLMDTGQNNLSYMQQLMNGWLQGIDGSTLGDFDFGC